MGYPEPPSRSTTEKLKKGGAPYPLPPGDQERPKPAPPRDGYITAYQIAVKHGKAFREDGTLLTEEEWISLYGDAIDAAWEAAAEANAAADRLPQYVEAAENAAHAAENSAELAGEYAESIGGDTETANAAAAAAEAARDETLSYSANPPILGDDLYWYTWDGTAYKNTGVKASMLLDENSGEKIRMWFGTVQEYNALERIESDVYYNILEGSA